MSQFGTGVTPDRLLYLHTHTHKQPTLPLKIGLSFIASEWSVLSITPSILLFSSVPFAVFFPHTDIYLSHKSQFCSVLLLFFVCVFSLAVQLLVHNMFLRVEVRTNLGGLAALVWRVVSQTVVSWNARNWDAKQIETVRLYESGIVSVRRYIQWVFLAFSGSEGNAGSVFVERLTF